MDTNTTLDRCCHVNNKTKKLCKAHSCLRNMKLIPLPDGRLMCKRHYNDFMKRQYLSLSTSSLPTSSSFSTPLSNSSSSNFPSTPFPSSFSTPSLSPSIQTDIPNPRNLMSFRSDNDDPKIVDRRGYAGFHVVIRENGVPELIVPKRSIEDNLKLPFKKRLGTGKWILKGDYKNDMCEGTYCYTICVKREGAEMFYHVRGLVTVKSSICSEFGVDFYNKFKC